MADNKRGAFAIEGTTYTVAVDGAEMWATAYQSPEPHHYPGRVEVHYSTQDPTRRDVWIEFAGLICFPGRIGVDISPLV